jgi:hypothetical protein
VTAEQLRAAILAAMRADAQLPRSERRLLVDVAVSIAQPEIDRARAELAQAQAAGYRQAVADATEANATLGRTRATDQLLAAMRDGVDLYTRYAAIKTAAAPSATT